MSGTCALKEKDRMARAFIDGVIGGPVCIGYMPQKWTAETLAALWLAEDGAKAIKKAEKKVICLKAGSDLATAIADAKWRKENGKVIAEADYFAYSFTAAPDGWRLSECEMLWTARADLRSYLHIFGDFRHLSERGVLPDFYLRDLTAEEIKESGLREGAVLSVSSVVMKEMGRYHTRKASKREKRMRAILNEWRERGGSFSGEPKPKPRKNALVIVQGKKEGEGWNRTNMSNPVHID